MRLRADKNFKRWSSKISSQIEFVQNILSNLDKIYFKKPPKKKFSIFYHENISFSPLMHCTMLFTDKGFFLNIVQRERE